MPGLPIELTVSPRIGHSASRQGTHVAFKRADILNDIALLAQKIARLEHASRNQAISTLTPLVRDAIAHYQLAIVCLIQELSKAGMALPSEQELSHILEASYIRADEKKVYAAFAAYWPHAEETAYHDARASIHFDAQSPVTELLELAFLKNNSHLFEAFRNARIALAKKAFLPDIQHAVQVFGRLSLKTEINANELKSVDFAALKNNLTSVSGLTYATAVFEKLSAKAKEEQRLKAEQRLKEAPIKRNLSRDLWFKKIALYLFLCWSPFLAAETTETANSRVEAIEELRGKLEDEHFGLDDVAQWKVKHTQKLNTHRYNSWHSISDRGQRTDDTATMKIINQYTANISKGVRRQV